jgi:hypothetical protein
MRFIAAIAGILLSVPPLIFFWIGAQTFIKAGERLLATAIAIETLALLAASIALFFAPSVQHVQLVLLVATMLSLTAVAVAMKILK